MSRKKVAVIMGGPSAEHEVSINSGKAVLESMDGQKYDPTEVVVSKENTWSFGGEKLVEIEALKRLQSYYAVFIALHGTYGEDGTLQVLLEKVGVPFTGSGSSASFLCMDKAASNLLYELNDMGVPDWEVLNSPSALPLLPLPFVVKPIKQGSSVGVSIVEDYGSVNQAIEKAFEFDNQVMVQKYIVGREVSCGVLDERGEIRALPPTELIPRKAKFFDYDEKYSKDGALEVTPPEMDEAIIKKIQDMAVKAHQILGCSGYSRTDMFITEKGEVKIIETNTLPGLTRTSILPQQAEAAGISFGELVDKIIVSANIKTDSLK